MANWSNDHSKGWIPIEISQEAIQRAGLVSADRGRTLVRTTPSARSSPTQHTNTRRNDEKPKTQPAL
uniref:SPDY domain-containing protein n=1 Tax=Bursaphelenchus xylophilus TaxID=6326 RepID=A0A1I7RIZ3_BURXY